MSNWNDALQASQRARGSAKQHRRERVLAKRIAALRAIKRPSKKQQRLLTQLLDPKPRYFPTPQHLAAAKLRRAPALVITLDASAAAIAASATRAANEPLCDRVK